VTAPLESLLRDLAGSLGTMAERLASAADALHEQAARDGAQPLADRVVAYARQKHPALGQRQEPMLRVVAAAHPDGISHAAASAAMPEPSLANDYLTLKALIARGLVSKDDKTSPHHYYLADDMIRAVNAT
jgi:hypothetical protein